MNSDDLLFKTILDRVINDKKLTANFLQYHHRGSCATPCRDCPERDKRIYKRGEHIKLPAHPHCDCYYTNVETKPLEKKKKRQPSPDVWIKHYGKLPDYYITKEEAKEKYGWIQGKNTLAGKAPEKMIGGDIFNNNPVILPQKENRTWKECDIDYVSGRRSKARLYYSNDGLMFYSPDHLAGDVTVYQIL